MIWPDFFAHLSKLDHLHSNFLIKLQMNFFFTICQFERDLISEISTLHTYHSLSSNIQHFHEFFDIFFRSSDEGKYTCVRTNEAGSVNAEAWISVLVRTQIIQPPVDTKVILGKDSY